MSDQPSPMRSDPLIDEVRAIRAKLWDECGRDFERVAEQLREIQRRYADRLRPAHPTGARPEDRRTA